MKSASQIFYLAVFSLLGTGHGADLKAPTRSKPSGPDVCAISPKAIVSDACASFSTLDELNKLLRPTLLEITQKTDFFSYYRLNLYGKECPFWNDESGMCGNRACAVNTLDNEEDIPMVWRAEELGKLEGPKAVHPGKRLQAERGLQKPLQGMLGEDVGESCVVEYDDECDERDYCVPEDESAGSKGDYVSLVDNPERFTGYAGEGTAQVWNAIYRENCFSKSSFPKSASLGTSPSLQRGPAANELKFVMAQNARQQALGGQQKVTLNTPGATETGLEPETECLEKRVFYRVVSGMHTSISTHLCWSHLNQTTGEWGPNLACYKHRLHNFPDRVANLYFNYALVLRAVTKLGPHLKDYTFCSGDPLQDTMTKAKVQELTTVAAASPPIFDETLMFVNGEGPSLKEDFRNRFRNVSRIMDCVGCDKCRLWGKLQTAGYGAALKVLFEFDNDSDEIPTLKRTELVALFNTLSRISSSLEAISGFRKMVEDEEDAAEAERLTKETKPVLADMPDRATKPHNVIPGKKLEEPESSPEPIQEKPTATGSAPEATKVDDATGVEEKANETTPEPVKSEAKEKSPVAITIAPSPEPHLIVPERDFEEFQSEKTATIDYGFDEEPDLDFTRKPLPANATIGEVFNAEFALVWKVTKYVVKSWVTFPAIAWDIIKLEISRAWNSYIGLPVEPRKWVIKRPKIDEL